jgi:NADH:ubiquinone oxidoreductase subunit 3 (subunit A)
VVGVVSSGSIDKCVVVNSVRFCGGGGEKISMYECGFKGIDNGEQEVMVGYYEVAIAFLNI